MGIMQLINIILFWLFFGLLASHFAKKRGRSQVNWFIIGLSLGVIGIITLLLLPKIEKTIARPKLSSSPKRSDAWLKMWYYLDSTHVPQGPLEFPDFIKKCKEKSIEEAQYIWGEGMTEWKRLSELPDLIKEIEQA